MVLLPKLHHDALKAIALVWALCSVSGAAVSVTVSSSAPASLQDDFIATATNQYEGTLTKVLNVNTWTFKITGKKPAPSPVVQPCQLDRDIAILVDTVTAISKGNYVYCFADGMDYERAENLGTLTTHSTYCSTDTLCSDVIKGTSDEIFLKMGMP